MYQVTVTLENEKTFMHKTEVFTIETLDDDTIIFALAHYQGNPNDLDENSVTDLGIHIDDKTDMYAFAYNPNNDTTMTAIIETVETVEKYLDSEDYIKRLPEASQTLCHKYNAAKEKAWKRIDGCLTRVHSGLYFVRIVNKLYMIDRNDELRGGKWVFHEDGHPEHVADSYDFLDNIRYNIANWDSI